MAVRRQICRYESKATEVSGKLFFNESLRKASMQSMRQAAKRFVLSEQFTSNCLYYYGTLVNNRWQFEPYGIGQSFTKEAN